MTGEHPEPLADRPLTTPHRDRLASTDPDYEAILAAHAHALGEGSPSYRDPRSGFSVFTAAYLAARGTCCGKGCRHCPFLP